MEKIDNMKKLSNFIILEAIKLSVAFSLAYLTLLMYNIADKAFSVAFLGGAVSIIFYLRCSKFLNTFKKQ